MPGSVKRSKPLFFLLPSIILIIGFYLAPLILTVWISFTPLTNWKVKTELTEFIGLQNYVDLVYFMRYDPDVQKVIQTTVVFVVFTLVINVLGGLILAILTFLIDERISLSFRLLWLLPRMTPLAVFGLMWYYFFYSGPQGILNNILMSLGLIGEPRSWGTDPELLPWSAWSIIVFVNGLVGVSYGMIIFYSAFKNIPREILIAARVDGARTWEVIRYIMIPMVRWHIVFVTVWQLLSLITSYAHLFVLVQWSVVDKWYGTTLSLYVFDLAFGDFKLQGLAAAAAVFLVAIGGVLGWLTLRIMRIDEMIQAPKGDI